MEHFLISYDVGDGSEYGPVIDRIKKLGGVKILESVWLCSAPMDAAELRDSLVGLIEKNHGFLVLSIRNDTNWAISNVGSESYDWLNTYARESDHSGDMESLSRMVEPFDSLQDRNRQSLQDRI